MTVRSPEAREVRRGHALEVMHTLDRLRKGIYIAEGFAHAKRVSIKSQHKQSALLEIVLDEGRNREVRRLLAKVGHKVLKLKRVCKIRRRY